MEEEQETQNYMMSGGDLEKFSGLESESYQDLDSCPKTSIPVDHDVSKDRGDLIREKLYSYCYGQKISEKLLPPNTLLLKRTSCCILCTKSESR